MTIKAAVGHSEIRLAYVVPTKDRPDDLHVLLKSLRRQTVQPIQIIIVDGSDPDIRYICDEYSDLNITYVRVFPPSLARQRNAGMSALQEDITHAGYLDDDLELDPDATLHITNFWQKAESNVGGVSMNITNQPPIRHSVFQQLFLMTGKTVGSVTASGFQCPIPSVARTTETRWLYGGATIWTRDVLNTYSYDEWFAGHGLGEDYEYSYRVGRAYKLFVCAEAKTLHHCGAMDAEKMYGLGRQQVFNRFYMFRIMGDFSPLLFAWSLLGLMLQAGLSSLRPGNVQARRRLMGNIQGLIDGIKDRKEPILEYWKK